MNKDGSSLEEGWHRSFDVKDGDLVRISDRYRNVMNDSRHGSAGFMPYSDPGPDPGIVIRTWVLNNVAMSQVLWPAGHISVVENQFLFVPASRL